MFFKANRNTRCNTTGPSIFGFHLWEQPWFVRRWIWTVALARALLRFSSMHDHGYWSENLISHINGFICLDGAYCGCSLQPCSIPVLKMAHVLFWWFIFFWWTTVQSLNSTPNTFNCIYWKSTPVLRVFMWSCGRRKCSVYLNTDKKQILHYIDQRVIDSFSNGESESRIIREDVMMFQWFILTWAVSMKKKFTQGHSEEVWSLDLSCRL